MVVQQITEDNIRINQNSTFGVGHSMFGVQSKPGIEAVNLIKMDTFLY